MIKKVSFNEEVKNEICNLEFEKKYLWFLLISLFINLIQIRITNNKMSYVISSQQPRIIKLIKSLSKEYDQNFNGSVILGNEHLDDKKNIYLSFDNIKLFEEHFNINDFDYNLIKDETAKKYFILGAYLSHGSISFSYKKSSYHFEINSHNIKYLENILKLLEFFNIKSKIIQREKTNVLYLKRAEYISDILKLFNVVDSLYKFEDYRIKKDFSNSLQRLNNLEVSNINKTINASLKLIEKIKILKENGIYDLLTEKEKIFCEIRLKEEGASLTDIANIFNEKYDIQITRTSLNHYVRKINSLVESINAKQTKT